MGLFNWFGGSKKSNKYTAPPPIENKITWDVVTKYISERHSEYYLTDDLFRKQMVPEAWKMILKYVELRTDENKLQGAENFLDYFNLNNSNSTVATKNIEDRIKLLNEVDNFNCNLNDTSAESLKNNIKEYINSTKPNGIYGRNKMDCLRATVNSFEEIGVYAHITDKKKISEDLERYALTARDNYKLLEANEKQLTKKIFDELAEWLDSNPQMGPMNVIIVFVLFLAVFLIASALLTGSPFTAFSILGSWLK